MAEAEKNEELKLHYYGDGTLKDCIERNFEHVKVNCSGENLWLNGKQKDLRKVKEAFHEVNVDKERKRLILTEPPTLEYLNTKIVETENCCLLKGRDGIYVFIPHRKKDDCIKQMGKLVQDEICKIDGVVVNTDDLLLDYAGKICRCGTSVLVFTKDIVNQVNKFIQQTGTDDDSTKGTPAIKQTQGNPPDRQTELEVKHFEIVLDENGKLFIERHCPNVSIHRTTTGFSLHTKSSGPLNTAVYVIPLDVDNNRIQLIFTGDGIIDFLNKKLQGENITCYLIKHRSRLYGLMPLNYKDNKQKVLHCINENICIKETDKPVDDEMIYDVLMEFSGNITHILTHKSVLVYTKSVEVQVDEYMKKVNQDKSCQKEYPNHKSDSKSDTEGESTKETPAIKETQGNPLVRQTELEVKHFGIVLDENGKLFIERHCPNVSIHRTTTGFSLHTKSSGPLNTAVYVIPLDVDNNRIQLIFTGDGIIDFLNKKLQGENIGCYLIKHRSRLYGLMPLNYKDYEQKILHCVNENICIKEIDKPVDDEMIYDVLMEFSGNITHILTHKSVLVYTKSVEVQVDEYMKKVNQDKSCQKEYSNHKSDSVSDTEGEYETVTDPGEKTLKGTRGSDKMDNFDKGDQNRESCKTVDDSGNQETEFVAGNILEESYEAIDIHYIYMDADLADYVFNYRRDDIRTLEKQSSIISNSNGIVTIDSKNCLYMEDGMNRIAQNACMHSFYINGDKFKTSQTEPFQDMLEKLQEEGTHIKMHPCFKTRVVKYIVRKDVTVEVVHGSAADIQQTEAILCPLDSNLNEACASAGHIMSKGKKFLAFRHTSKDFESQSITT